MSEEKNAASVKQAVSLQEFQQFQLSILNEFMRVCEEHELTWWLGFGTLLGAARHDGFIPWDDDIDIIMPSDDYLKFREACRKSLSKEYYLQSHEDNPCNFIDWERIGVKNTTSLPLEYATIHAEWGVCLDVFPAYPFPAPGHPDHEKKKKQIENFKRLSAKYLYRHEASQQESLARKMYYRLMGCMPDGMNVALWKRFERDLLIPFDTSVYDAVATGYGTFVSYPASAFSETVLLPFEGMQLPAPVGYKEILATFYGEDWMELPPEEKRVCHSGGGSDEVIVSLTEPYEQYLK